MKHEFLRKYLTNPRDFERWLKANVLVGSLVAVAILWMALVDVGGPDLHVLACGGAAIEYGGHD
jgi:hypothetical protein